MKDFNSKEYFEKLDKYFRAANYLSVAQIYLLKNPLLKEELKPADIKSRILGHFGTVPGQNFIYTHLNRAITKYDLNMLYISGPGHGGNFFLANSYLEGYYSEVYKDITEDEKGLTKLCKQFSFPGGVSSHVAPTLPGSIHEGGELGYSLAHGFGAVLDNPNLIAAVVVGDGEAETAPIATSWHSNKFINPKTDGAVLPILHLNGYKINSPTVLARISKEELESLFVGYGYAPIFVEGKDPKIMHKKMAAAMDKAIKQILKIQKNAREKKITQRPIWPMIILKTPKGWTGPKQAYGHKIEDSFWAHQVPIKMTEKGDFEDLKNWLLSYKPEELFDGYQLKDEIKAILPKGEKRISACPSANGGKLLKELKLPSLDKFEFKFKKPGSHKTQDMLELSGYLKEVCKKNNNFRLFCPDEAMSNRLYKVFESENRDFNAEIYADDDKLSVSGRVMDSYLSEHMCEGWLEGYLLTGRHGMFVSYESFIRVVDSMISQHAKWLKVSRELDWKAPIASLNLLLTSNVWQQDHNGYTHQEPGLIGHLFTKKLDMINVFLPADANSLLVCADYALKTKDMINCIVASKHQSPQWLTLKQAKDELEKGYAVWDFASNGNTKKPDIIFASAGDTVTLEAVCAAKILKEYLPSLNIKFVNILNLKCLDKTVGMKDAEFNQVFTKTAPIIFNFHSYTNLIYSLFFARENKNISVHGYN
ncbi:MAG: phosphoketolase family protein, partial [Clostridia bacterium]|nr:phosphoketolase family protein [Clostridia bacterium]